MEMVTAELAGTALTGPGVAGARVTVTMSPTGKQSLVLPPLGTWQRPSPHLPAYAQRLQQLLRGLRRTFGQGDWGVAWADDGRICWMLQVWPESG
jgi:pyruvate,water dikinase